MITNHPEYNDRGYSGGIIYSEKTNDGCTLDISSVRTSSGKYKEINAYLIRINYNNMEIVSLIIYEDDEDDYHYSTLKNILRSTTTIKKVIDLVFHFVIEFSYPTDCITALFSKSLKKEYERAFCEGQENVRSAMRELIGVSEK